MGCTKNLLDKTPLDSLSPETFYSNETQAKAGLMGVYNDLIPSQPIQWYQFDFMSDNNYCQDAWQGSNEFGAWLQNSSSGTAQTKWAKDYSLIVRANSFLANVDRAVMADAVKTQMKAEATFLRAYSYADLISYFGDVPLILKVQTLAEAKVSRTPKSEVLAAIITDLDNAAANLPVSYAGTDVGRATKGAALAFKAKILLYNEKWPEAAAAAKSVIDLQTYGLFSDYANLFSEDFENNKEVIFDIQYIKNLLPQPWPSSALSFAEWPTPSVTTDLINAYYMTNGLPISDPASGYKDQDPYKNRDPRLAASVVLPGSLKGQTIFIPKNDDVVCGARPRKYADLNNPDRNNCSINTILMRYADILLMRAEALIESGNTSQEIYDLIDQVRARVNMPKIENVEGAGLSQEQLRQILRHERRVEFFVEGTRYADMLRWKDKSLVHNVYGYDRLTLSDPSSPSTWKFNQIYKAARVFDPAKGWLWPIPQVDLQNNSNLKQNPGY
ncbi:RagB/SusD family nutrient uptake outer membrane protein [Mucilaginibacter dorajii]|uniref:RagB/SusD family nutrient uptake outer membrane protein n=2 Tax=Mucilaginibacter dorajii TaxID=692994 RepID=A0ABP7R0S7_9SPHI